MVFSQSLLGLMATGDQIMLYLAYSQDLEQRKMEVPAVTCSY